MDREPKLLRTGEIELARARQQICASTVHILGRAGDDRVLQRIHRRPLLDLGASITPVAGSDARRTCIG